MKYSASEPMYVISSSKLGGHYEASISTCTLTLIGSHNYSSYLYFCREQPQQTQQTQQISQQLSATDQYLLQIV